MNQTIESIIPKGASPSEFSVIILHYLCPEWSKKKIASVVGYKNPQEPRAVQRIFKKYNLEIRTISGSTEITMTMDVPYIVNCMRSSNA